MKTRLGRQESQLLAYAEMRGLRTVRTGELVGPLHLTPEQERELFRRMNRSGLVARVRPGLYLVPPRLPLGLRWSPTPAEAINALMDDCGGRYQLCGPNAFNRYGFDNQIPTRLYAYNNRISGNRKIGNVEIALIKVADRRLGVTETVSTPEGPTLVYSSRARSLVDAVYDWSRFNGIPRGYQWIREELAAKRVRPSELAELTLRYGDTGTIRRIGALCEQIEVPERILRKLEAELPATQSLIPFVPNRPKRGRGLSRWGVVLNDDASDKRRAAS
jgi:predicted transcriptional regulator of viral defense system